MNTVYSLCPLSPLGGLPLLLRIRSAHLEILGFPISDAY